MSDHSISCTLSNQLTDVITKTADAEDKGTTMVLAAGADEIGAGATFENAFTAYHDALSGCGGTVSYLLPNKTDVLVITYGTSVNGRNSWCVPMLQSIGTSGAIGSSEYYCTGSNSVSTTTDNGITATITIYAQKKESACSTP